MYGINIYNDIVILDINYLFNNNINQNYDEIVNYLYESALDKRIMIIRVGKNINISKIEKNYNLIKKIAKTFNSIEKKTIQKCYIFDTPKSFSNIFSFIKPIISKDVLNIIQFIKNDNINTNINETFTNISNNTNNISQEYFI